MTKNQNGFTFVELLLVLSITFVVSTSVIIFGKNAFEKQFTENFLTLLKLDIHYLQSHSMGFSQYTKLQFVNGGKEYVGTTSTREELFRRTLPTSIKMHEDSPLKMFGFHPNGSVDSLGKIYFVDDEGETYIVTPQIGRGRVILPE